MSAIALKQWSHFGRALIALGCILRHQLGNERLQPSRYAGIERTDGYGFLIVDLTKHGQRRGTVEGRRAGSASVEDTAEAEQIGAMVYRFAACLLRCHVLRRAGNHTVLSQRHIV